MVANHVVSEVLFQTGNGQTVCLAQGVQLVDQHFKGVLKNQLCESALLQFWHPLPQTGHQPATTIDCEWQAALARGIHLGMMQISSKKNAATSRSIHDYALEERYQSKKCLSRCLASDAPPE